MSKFLSETHKKHIGEANRGKTRSEKCKQKMSETRKRLFNEGKLQSWIKGKTWEERYGYEKAQEMKETKRKLRKGKTWGEIYGIEKAKEIRKQSSQSRKGLSLSEEQKKKISEALLGHKVSEETRTKIRNKNLGKHYSLENEFKVGHNKGRTYKEIYGVERAVLIKEKKHISGLKYKPTEETLKKLSKAMKGKLVREKHPMYGKHHSIDAIEKMKKSFFKKDHIPWNKDKILPEWGGENNPNWHGGKSFEPYGLDFNRRFKESIRVRDNYCCVVCNKMQEDLGYELSIHHIDYDKLNSFPQNCVSLCRECHAKTNINRDAWVTYFQKLLSLRFKYEYTPDQKIILDYTR